jgi:hypothetical protein
MIANRTIIEPGVWAPEDLIPAASLFKQLKRRGVFVTWSD